MEMNSSKFLNAKDVPSSEIEHWVLDSLESYTYVDHSVGQDIRLRATVEKLVIARGRNYWVMEESVRVFGPKNPERR